MSKALASISITHVYFNPQDKLSCVYAYITLSPLAIVVFYLSLIASRREMAGILMLSGQILNEIINSILKKAIKQERPFGHLGDGYGMPSSHSQFIWYFSVYGSLYLLNNITLDYSFWKLFSSVAMLTLAMLVSASRVYLGYHTQSQVIIGSLIGTAFALFWYLVVCQLYTTGVIAYLVDLPLARALYLKDMRLIDNVAKWEYLQWRETQSKKFA